MVVRDKERGNHALARGHVSRSLNANATRTATLRVSWNRDGERRATL